MELFDKIWSSYVEPWTDFKYREAHIFGLCDCNQIHTCYGASVPLWYSLRWVLKNYFTIIYSKLIWTPTIWNCKPVSRKVAQSTNEAPVDATIKSATENKLGGRRYSSNWRACISLDGLSWSGGYECPNLNLTELSKHLKCNITCKVISNTLLKRSNSIRIFYGIHISKLSFIWNKPLDCLSSIRYSG